MRPAAIVLNYSVKNIRNDIQQKIIIILIFDEKSQFNSLVFTYYSKVSSMIQRLLCHKSSIQKVLGSNPSWVPESFLWIYFSPSQQRIFQAWCFHDSFVYAPQTKTYVVRVETGSFLMQTNSSLVPRFPALECEHWSCTDGSIFVMWAVSRVEWVERH